MKLADYGESLAHDVAFWMLGMDDPSYPPERLGKLSLEISTKLRALAIITLLVKAESDYFFHNLIRSGSIRETYLRRVIAAGLLEDHHRSLGRFDPLLDLIAARAFGDVRRIEALSPAEFRPGHEYEDDYWYASILHEMCKESPDESRIGSLLDCFEKALDGMGKTRLDLCRALAARDQESFSRSFQGLLSRHASQIAKDRERGILEEPAILAERQIFIEGLAVLQLAELRGLTTDEEYPYCPSLARVPMLIPFPYQ